jgi:type I restriction enzyme M protein
VTLRKSDLYGSLWRSCDELRGGMDASQYKDYILTLLFVKYVSDKQKTDPDSLIDVPEGGSFDDIVALGGDKEIGEKINKIIARLAEANELQKVIDLADFNDEEKLGKGKEMQDRLQKLVLTFADLDFRGSRAEGDDLLGDAYEYLMRHFATESGKSKGQFYTPAEVSRIMAKVVGIDARTRQDQTVYDPASGSGSLLLKAAAEAPRGMSIYGQEKDIATWALARMNMILHSNEIAEIEKGDTISSPAFTRGAKLRTFDFVVMNPPFSLKSWSNGLENEYGRFEFGMPPAKNGDYAFLLHALKSLKSTGKAAVIMPHGVLFRGHSEAAIRKALLKHGFVKGVIGLPPNLFYGTGIPACIVVLDKENAQARSGVFMIDASKGFVKDGAKNRLRSQDIHKIVDVFTTQAEIPRYSRMVPFAEIEDLENDFNLNLPRYIDSSEPEDRQDLRAHLHGGIPERDVDALEEFWDAFPQLRSRLFDPGRPGYLELALDVPEVRQAIVDSEDFRRFAGEMRALCDAWFAEHRPGLAAITENTKPADLVAAISEDLIERFELAPLLDSYDVYEQLMSYWGAVMHDDVLLVMHEGWVGAAQPRLAIKDKDRKLSEQPDLIIGSGKKATKYKTDLIPPDLVIARYFDGRRPELAELARAADAAQVAVAEYFEEHGTDEGLLADAVNEKGKVTQAELKETLEMAEGAGDTETADCARGGLALLKAEGATKKARNQAQAALAAMVKEKYGTLGDAEVRQLLLDDKWAAAMRGRVDDVIEALVATLAMRIAVLGERYADTVGTLEAELDVLSGRVTAHLEAMGAAG